MNEDTYTKKELEVFTEALMDITSSPIKCRDFVRCAAMMDAREFLRIAVHVVDESVQESINGKPDWKEMVRNNLCNVEGKPSWDRVIHTIKDLRTYASTHPEYFPKESIRVFVDEKQTPCYSLSLKAAKDMVEKEAFALGLKKPEIRYSEDAFDS